MTGPKCFRWLFHVKAPLQHPTGSEKANRFLDGGSSACWRVLYLWLFQPPSAASYISDAKHYLSFYLVNKGLFGPKYIFMFVFLCTPQSLYCPYWTHRSIDIYCLYHDIITHCLYKVESVSVQLLGTVIINDLHLFGPKYILERVKETSQCQINEVSYALVNVNVKAKNVLYKKHNKTYWKAILSYMYLQIGLLIN